jgi:hypothetical protein
MALRSLSAQQIRNAWQVGFAGFLATGLYLSAGDAALRIDGFYVVYGVARSLLPTPEASLKAAKARIVGTVFGGLVVVMLIKAVSNWLAVGIGYVLVKLLGRRLGLDDATLMNGVIMALLLVAVPGYQDMGGLYVLYRTGWHLIGLMLGMAVERLFWFSPLLKRLQSSELALIAQLEDLLNRAPAQRDLELIGAYDSHCSLRSIVLRSDQAAVLSTPESQQRQEWLERAVRHGVARQRVQGPLAAIDADGCSEALRQLKCSGGVA